MIYLSDMETMTPMAVISLAPSTKEQAADFTQKLISKVESGEENPLSLAVKMNAFIKSLESVKKAIDDSILREAEKYGAKSFDAFGAEITISELGTKYDYSICGDSEWQMLNQQLDSLKESIKQREKVLKSLTKPMTVVNELSGEIETINPPIKTSTTGIKIVLR